MVARQNELNPHDSPTLILSISLNPAVAETRRLLLEQYGYHVVVATNFLEVKEKCRDMRFACAIIGTDIEAAMKRAIAKTLEESCSQMPILEIVRGSQEIERASSVESNEPEVLLAAVDDLLHPTGRRYTEQLHRRTQTIQEKTVQSVAVARQIRATARKFTAQSAKSRFWGKNPSNEPKR
jgi:DNA-binding response OmpR family regulator